jgi:hypothetical protein
VVKVLASSYPVAVSPVEGRRLRGLLEVVQPLSRGLASIAAPSTPFFFRDLIGHDISSLAVSHFCALLARGLNEFNTSDQGPAMFVPPNPSPVSSDFWVHSDLFPSRRLLIIYDQVHAPEWAASLLLSWANAFRALEQAEVSSRSLAIIRRLLTRSTTDDGFDELFRLLYDDSSPRGQRIAELLRVQSVCIPFRRGEGYLLDDRQWVHGRLLTRGSTTRARFRRLVF